MKFLISNCLAGQHDEALNIAAHECDGWTEINNTPGYWRGVNRHQIRMPLHCLYSDLNAMARLALSLKGYQRAEYTVKLRRIVVIEMDSPEYQDPDTGRLLDIYFYEATARQRLVALLLTVRPEMFQAE